MASLKELEELNPPHLGAKWCLLCGQIYPFPGHTPDCKLSGYVSKPEPEPKPAAPRETKELGKDIKPEKPKQAKEEV